MPLPQQLVALVTGASRGVGRGVATGLANAGARVYATGPELSRTRSWTRALSRSRAITRTTGRSRRSSIGSMAKRAGSTCSSTRSGADTSAWSKTAASRRRSGTAREDENRHFRGKPPAIRALLWKCRTCGFTDVDGAQPPQVSKGGNLLAAQSPARVPADAGERHRRGLPRLAGRSLSGRGSASTFRHARA